MVFLITVCLVGWVLGIVIAKAVGDAERRSSKSNAGDLWLAFFEFKD